MSTISYPSFTDLNDQHLYLYNHHQPIIVENPNPSQRTLEYSSSTLSAHLNEDDRCQICGDLASGWHCG